MKSIVAEMMPFVTCGCCLPLPGPLSRFPLLR